jgi:hypothetical protein
MALLARSLCILFMFYSIPGYSDEFFRFLPNPFKPYVKLFYLPLTPKYHHQREDLFSMAVRFGLRTLTVEKSFLIF